MGETSGISGGTAGPWYRVEALTASCIGGTAERDYASVLPAALNAAMHGRPFVAGWLSRGGGAPLELITSAGPLPTAASPVRRGPGRRERDAGGPHLPQAGRDSPEEWRDRAAGLDRPRGAPGGRHELLFPWGARGAAFTASLLADL